MLALCLMLLVTYHALNYAGIIALDLNTCYIVLSHLFLHVFSVPYNGIVILLQITALLLVDVLNYRPACHQWQPLRSCAKLFRNYF